MGLLSPYLGSAKELSSERGASINRVGGKASFTEAKLAHKTPSAPLSPAAKAHTKSLLTGHYSPTPVVLYRAPVPKQPPSSRAAKKLFWVRVVPRPTGESFLNTCMLLEKARSVDFILSNRLGSERTISTDNNTNLKHLQAGSREKEGSALMSFLLMPQVNEQSRVLLRLRELKCCCSSQFPFKFLCIIYTSVKEATFYLFNLSR